MARITQNAILEADGSRFKISKAVESVVEYVKRFTALPIKPRQGYDKYWNDDGFTNPESVKSLSPQGVGKLMAVLVEHAHSLIASGGNESSEMAEVLEGIRQYDKIASEEIAKRNADNLLAEALKTVGPEKLAEFAAKHGLAVAPAPTDVATIEAEPVAATEPVAETEQTEEATEAVAVA